MRTRTLLPAALVFMVTAASAASAQAPAAPGSQPRDPNMPSTRNTVPEKIDSTGSTGTLSDKLNRSEGVITPPSIDSGMTVKPPVANPGTTPVIIPPGEPGGNQAVQPK